MKDTITLKVIGFLEAEVVHEFGVRVKLTGKLGKLKEVCSKRMGVQVSRLRFRFKSQRIYDEDTPKALKMKDGDIIEVFMSNTINTCTCCTCVNIKVKDWNNEMFDVKLQQNAKIDNLKWNFSQRVGIPVPCLKFIFKAVHLNGNETPQSLEMKHGDIIEVSIGCDHVINGHHIQVTYTEMNRYILLV